MGIDTKVDGLTTKRTEEARTSIQTETNMRASSKTT